MNIIVNKNFEKIKLAD